MHYRESTLASSSKGLFQCRLFECDVKDDTIGACQQLADKSSAAFAIDGHTESFQLPFPAPYSSVKVQVNLMMAGYGESNDGYLPNVQAFFDGKNLRDNLKDYSFNLEGQKAGSKILLRDYLNFSDTVFLTYQCSLNFVD
jgi:hypothetical protein